MAPTLMGTEDTPEIEYTPEFEEFLKKYDPDLATLIKTLLSGDDFATVELYGWPRRRNRMNISNPRPITI